ncbi:AlbA family DNA-binding domain-containing protein [Rugamonas aquatica]|uniref:AlbA family DNA-binding domain-containing protein n=1 Tax=Rugamonas aquatica TaxID=2743357 RepID=UPI001C2DBEDE|nr:ATP-binding protein [Rugamonas aquatica]
MVALPINLQNLLRHRTVESERIEYKAAWNPDAVIRTLCAFANDFENLGGGYTLMLAYLQEVAARWRTMRRSSP